MERRGGERVGVSARVLVRPIVMLAIGVAAGLVMWRVLMADVGPDPSLGHRLGQSQVESLAASFDRSGLR